MLSVLQKDPLWVRNRHPQDTRRCPLYPRKRTFCAAVEKLVIRSPRRRAVAARADHFQSDEIHRDPSRLVFREQLGRRTTKHAFCTNQKKPGSSARSLTASAANLVRGDVASHRTLSITKSVPQGSEHPVYVPFTKLPRSVLRCQLSLINK